MLTIRNVRGRILFAPELLQRFHRFQQELEDARKIGRIIIETGCSAEEAGAPSRGADGPNWERRRGLPLIGRGVSGANGKRTRCRRSYGKEARGDLRR